jgi:RNase H-fold protein (predicted Holliday junction resolvase)
MNPIQPFRILAITPTTKGVGFAVLEGKDTLVDWGVKNVSGKKNAGSIENVEKLITRYQPDVLVLGDALAKDSHRCLRIRRLLPQIIKVATTHQLKVELFSRDHLMQTFIPESKGTKHAVAEVIAKKFPEQLGFKLPPKRKAWMREHYQMAIFDAVALAWGLRLKQINAVRNSISDMGVCGIFDK